MQEIDLTICRREVYEEVAKTTAYTGAKMIGEDIAAYDRISTTEEDRVMLGRFWCEACDAATEALRQFISSVSTHEINRGVSDDDYQAVLALPSSYDNTLTSSVQSSLFSFFVSSITAKWFRLANKKEADGYYADALARLDDVVKKVYYRMKPVRQRPQL